MSPQGNHSSWPPSDLPEGLSGWQLSWVIHCPVKAVQLAQPLPSAVALLTLIPQSYFQRCLAACFLTGRARGAGQGRSY